MEQNYKYIGENKAESVALNQTGSNCLLVHLGNCNHRNAVIDCLSGAAQRNSAMPAM